MKETPPSKGRTATAALTHRAVCDSHLPVWRNWQTHCVQSAAPERVCGFDSHGGYLSGTLPSRTRPRGVSKRCCLRKTVGGHTVREALNVDQLSNARIAQQDRVFEYESKGRGFESLYGYVEVAQESRLAQHVSAVKGKSGGAVNLVASMGLAHHLSSPIGIAQLAEHRPHMAVVGGSIPPAGTVNEAKAVAATGCDPVPSGFKSRRSPHFGVGSMFPCVNPCPSC